MIVGAERVFVRGYDCPWCVDPADDNDYPPEVLCRPHQAEQDCTTVAELDRRDAEERADLL